MRNLVSPGPAQLRAGQGRTPPTTAPLASSVLLGGDGSPYITQAPVPLLTTQFPPPAIGISGRPQTIFAGSASFLGWYFCVRPPKTSAMYRFPSASAVIWCTAQVYPGLVPNCPNANSRCPRRSYFTTRSEIESYAQTCSSALMIMVCGATLGHWSRNLPFSSN